MQVLKPAGIAAGNDARRPLSRRAPGRSRSRRSHAGRATRRRPGDLRRRGLSRTHRRCQRAPPACPLAGARANVGSAPQSGPGVRSASVPPQLRLRRLPLQPVLPAPVSRNRRSLADSLSQSGPETSPAHCRSASLRRARRGAAPSRNLVRAIPCSSPWRPRSAPSWTI